MNLSEAIPDESDRLKVKEVIDKFMAQKVFIVEGKSWMKQEQAFRKSKRKGIINGYRRKG